MPFRKGASINKYKMMLKCYVSRFKHDDIYPVSFTMSCASSFSSTIIFHKMIGMATEECSTKYQFRMSIIYIDPN